MDVICAWLNLPNMGTDFSENYKLYIPTYALIRRKKITSKFQKLENIKFKFLIYLPLITRSRFLIPNIASIVCLGVSVCPLNPNLRDVSLTQISSEIR